MESRELRDALNSNCVTRPFFKGVFASDRIPKVPKSSVKKDQFYIFNFDPQHKSGSHWVCAMLRPKGKKNVYFDSGGNPPSVPTIKRFVGQSFVYNTRELQFPLSTTCGQWCAFFIWKRCRGKRLKKMVKGFDKKDLLMNDHIINFWVRKIFKINKKVIQKRFLHQQIAKARKLL